MDEATRAWAAGLNVGDEVTIAYREFNKNTREDESGFVDSAVKRATPKRVVVPVEGVDCMFERDGGEPYNGRPFGWGGIRRRPVMIPPTDDAKRDHRDIYERSQLLTVGKSTLARLSLPTLRRMVEALDVAHDEDIANGN